MPVLVRDCSDEGPLVVADEVATSVVGRTGFFISEASLLGVEVTVGCVRIGAGDLGWTYGSGFLTRRPGLKSARGPVLGPPITSFFKSLTEGRAG